MPLDMLVDVLVEASENDFFDPDFDEIDARERLLDFEEIELS